MSKIHVAFWWHHHQPYYKDNVTGEWPMPWVRLHGVKDYFGMAALIEEFPKIKATINIVPSMLVQLLDYVENCGEDMALRLARKPAADLKRDEKEFILQNFFMANPEWMIRPYARYRDLLTKRRPRDPDMAAAIRRFAEQDFLDLQVWANLVWFHPKSLEQDSFLRDMILKGRRFSEEEKAGVLRRQMDILAQILPLHRRLEERGQIETTTSPFYHPILPLLCNPASAREAMPDVLLPKEAHPNIDDAREQIARSVRFHEEKLGRRPRGMWPSEGSVCPETARLVREAGIEWLGTDEQILERSVKKQIERRENGDLRNPEVLYRPYRFKTESGPLTILFRDRNLADLIGFQYQRSRPEAAAEDLAARIARIKATDSRPPLVSIILDGENAWEYYPKSGVEFLRDLYTRLSEHPNIETTTVSRYLDQFPAEEALPKIFAGSWIDHNFSIWIGHKEDRAAWDYLYKTRRFLADVERSGKVDKEIVKRAWEEIYIAEGSDWFWWFGDDHHTDQIKEFDDLFRRHLKNVYALVGEEPPMLLDRPIAERGVVSKYSQPLRFLDVKVDGRITSFLEWVDAGRCNLKRAGAMDQTGERILRDLHFGFGADSLFLRIDVEGEKELVIHEGDSLRVHFYSPQQAMLAVEGLYGETQRAEIVEGRAGDAAPKAAFRHVIEVSCPFAALGFAENELVGFFVELIRNGEVLERAPRVGGVEFAVPTSDFEKISWQV
ncbi:MAG: glycoside hydrolase family 57 protein [Planctomycetota bacterium]